MLMYPHIFLFTETNHYNNTSPDNNSKTDYNAVSFYARNN